MKQESYFKLIDDAISEFTVLRNENGSIVQALRLARATANDRVMRAVLISALEDFDLLDAHWSKAATAIRKQCMGLSW